MELSGYEVTIIGGRHISKPVIRPTLLTNRYDKFGRRQSFAHLFPWSPFSPFGEDPVDTSFPGTTERSYVEMTDGDHYKIQLRNNHPTRCNAEVEIDGKSVGTWRLSPYQTVQIERPAKIDKKFTFYKIGDSFKNSQIGLKRGDPNNGLIRVKFTPEDEFSRRSIFYDDDYYSEYDRVSPLRSYRSLAANSFKGASRQSYSTTDGFNLESATPQCMTANSRGREVFSNVNHCQGGTALRGRSDQDFGHARPMSLDRSKSVTINLRLVARRQPRYDDFYSEITPLGSPVSNPVPPPVTWAL